ncbi:MAG: DUF805 domain-containing protein [Candidatus Sedimenticola sp. (ex Thyasira tokunagai)]
MSSENPYSTPEASVEVEAEEYYQPKFFSVSGRIGRLRYLAYVSAMYLLIFTLMVPIMGSSALLGSGQAETVTGITGILVILAYIIITVFTIVCMKRRLNDLNKTGMLALLVFVPLANFLLAIYIIFFRGSEGPNRYGPAPTANSMGVKALGLLLPIIAIVGILAAIAIPAYQGYVEKAQQAQMQSQ